MTNFKQRAEGRGREVRRLAVNHIQLRAAEEGSTAGPLLTGYACVTNSPYEMHDMFGPYDEVVRSGAFAKSITENDDVRLLLNHDGLPLARTKSGTLKLTEVTKPDAEGRTGLWCEAELDPDSHIVADIRSAMKRGDLDEMSFAFQVTKQEWSPDYMQRDIQEVRLFDVSVVTYPANPATSASMRSGQVMDMLPEGELRELYSRLHARYGTPKVDEAAQLVRELKALNN